MYKYILRVFQLLITFRIAVWCNIGYRVKRHLDLKDRREPINDPEHAQYNEFSRTAIFGALQELARTPALKHLVPNTKLIKAVPILHKNKPVKRKNTFVLENDKNLYIPPPDDDDVGGSGDSYEGAIDPNLCAA